MIKYTVVYMKLKGLFKRIRDFVICCKKTVNDIDNVLEDVDDLQWFGNPTYKPPDNDKETE